MRWIRENIKSVLLTGLFLVLTVGLGFVLVTDEQARKKAMIIWHDALVWVGVHDDLAQSGDIYWCPMHPQIKRTNANEVCPICNMALVKLEVGTQLEGAEGLSLTTRQIQQAGVATELALRRNLFREIDSTGRLTYDERRLAQVTSWIHGKSRIEDLHVNFTGDLVEQGAVIAEVYSPDLYVAQQEYFLSLKTFGSLPAGVDLQDMAREKLIFQGLASEQIEELASNGKPWDRVPIQAPITGTVIRKHVEEGQYVNEGDPLFQIADLHHLWLIADVFEGEISLVRLGQEATFSVEAYRDKKFRGVIAFIDYMVQPGTRAIRVRMDVKNSDLRLKVGMYARVQFRAELPDRLSIPENAVLWSGRRAVVLVREGEGLFQPREVQLGGKWLYSSINDSKDGRNLDFSSGQRRYHEVVTGLSPGDEVVTAGAFLLNAESQFQGVLAKMLPSKSEFATLQQIVGEPIASGIRSMLLAYHGLSEALADDDSSSLPEKAKALSREAKLLAEQAGNDSNPDLASLALRLSESANHLTTLPPNLKDARKKFATISRSFVELLSKHGGKTLLGGELFVFECPMAGEFGYKLWLRPNRDMQNPYMGPRMPNCGIPIKKLEVEGN